MINATGPSTLRFVPPLVITEARSTRRCGAWPSCAVDDVRRAAQVEVAARAHAEPLGDAP